MGFRFQRRFKIAPGITLNLSKSGVSTSIGTRGARVTLGHGKTRTTVGIPGTGLSLTDVVKTDNTESSPIDSALNTLGTIALIVFVIVTVLLFWR